MSEPANTRELLLKFHEEICGRGRNLMQRKNHDYSGEKGDDPYANFRRVEAMGICSVEQGFLVRMSDKMSRLSTFASAGKLLVEDEGAQDTLIDLINYAVLLAGYLTTKQLIVNKNLSPDYVKRIEEGFQHTKLKVQT